MNKLKPEEVAAVPTAEIARWTSRLDRIDYAVQQNRSVSYGGDWGDDTDQLIYMMARAESQNWRDRDPNWEEVVLFALKGGLHYAKVMRASGQEKVSGQGEKDNMALRERQIGRTALRKGLVRLDLLEPSDIPGRLMVPVGVAAALCFRRADIKEPIDRTLYERHETIGAAIQYIDTAVKPRTITYKQVHHTSDGDKLIDVRAPVYSFLSFERSSRAVEKLGLRPGAELNPWWQELQNDLARIDETSESL